MRFLTLTSILALFLLSCSDDSDVNAVPEISFVSISPTTVVSAQETVVIRISYFDGDGDLGENDANIKNLFLTDSRNDVSFSFRIPQLAPSGESISIQGELPIEISTVALIGDGSVPESVQYTVRLVDRAGNESNIVETTSITIQAQ